MKFSRLFAAILILVAAMPSARAAEKVQYVPGKDLTLIGKLMPTPDRYARVDTLKYDGFTDYQRQYLNQTPAGLALVFTTDSREILLNFDYKKRMSGYNTNDIAFAGGDLYICRDGKWLYAGSGVPSEEGKPVKLVANMAPGEKECLLYLPLRSIIDEVYVGVDSGAKITSAPNPFNRKVVFWGSSFTHGTSSNRPGMPYPLQFQRATGLDVRSLGVSGNSKLQQSYARVLADTEADAFVFDAFSNPKAPEIRELFAEFVKTIRAKHPTTPLIFQQTIYRAAEISIPHSIAARLKKWRRLKRWCARPWNRIPTSISFTRWPTLMALPAPTKPIPPIWATTTGQNQSDSPSSKFSPAIPRSNLSGPSLCPANKPGVL